MDTKFESTNLSHHCIKYDRKMSKFSEGIFECKDKTREGL